MYIYHLLKHTSYTYFNLYHQQKGVGIMVCKTSSPYMIWSLNLDNQELGDKPSYQLLMSAIRSQDLFGVTTIYLWVHPPIMNSWCTQSVWKTLSMALPYGSHLHLLCIGLQLHLDTANYFSSSTISSWHISLHNFIHCPCWFS